MSDANKATVQRFVEELFVNGNDAIGDELVADDFVDHMPMPGAPPGKTGLKHIASIFRGAFSNLQITSADLIAEGDKVVQRTVFTGTHTGELMGIAATGKTVSMNEIHIVRFADGKIVEHWGVEDNLGMMQQLGVVEGP